MKRKFLIPYAVATLAMAAAICTTGIPSVALARTYDGYNGMKRSSTAEETFQEIKVPAFASIKEVTAEEARSVADGIIVFAFPTCPYCRNLMPELIETAKEEGKPLYYCQIDNYRDKYEFDETLNGPVMTVAPGKGYYELLDWLSDYLIDYTVKDENGESISIGEKRIGAPTIITVQNGVPVSSWKLSMVENAEFPDNAYTRWSQETQEIVSESLHQYFAEEA